MRRMNRWRPVFVDSSTLGRFDVSRWIRITPPRSTTDTTASLQSLQ